MDPPPTAEASLVARLVDLAASPYRRVGPFAWRFARGKLGGDTLFATLLRTGAIPAAGCLVDLGCGQGLLAAWIHAAHDQWSSKAPDLPWPSTWPTPPRVGTYLGVDRSRREIARAKAALPPFARVFQGDVTTIGMTMLDRCDVVTILDVMQYLAPQDQARLLAAIAARLPPWGVLVMRVGDGAETIASRWSNTIDLVVCAVRGQPRWRLHRRSLADWSDLLVKNGFRVEILDDGRSNDPSGHRRFANVLIRAVRPEAQSSANA